MAIRTRKSGVLGVLGELYDRRQNIVAGRLVKNNPHDIVLEGMKRGMGVSVVGEIGDVVPTVGENTERRRRRCWYGEMGSEVVGDTLYHGHPWPSFWLGSEFPLGTCSKQGCPSREDERGWRHWQRVGRRDQRVLYCMWWPCNGPDVNIVTITVGEL